MNDTRVIIQQVRDGSQMPTRTTPGAAGFDLHACLLSVGHITLWPGEHRLIPTGLLMHIPEGWEGQIRPRSGLALKKGLTVLNTPGTIDADYRGEVGVILINHGPDPVSVDHGDRIAQIVFAPTHPVALQFGTVAQNTERGGGGFGSTGT